MCNFDLTKSLTAFETQDCVSDSGICPRLHGNSHVQAAAFVPLVAKCLRRCAAQLQWPHSFRCDGQLTSCSHLENIMDNTQIHKKRMTSNLLESLIAENVLMNSWLKLGMRPTTLTHAGLRSWEHGFERPKYAIYLLFSPQLSVQNHLFK